MKTMTGNRLDFKGLEVQPHILLTVCKAEEMFRTFGKGKKFSLGPSVKLFV